MVLINALTKLNNPYQYSNNFWFFGSRNAFLDSVILFRLPFSSEVVVNLFIVIGGVKWCNCRNECKRLDILLTG